MMLSKITLKIVVVIICIVFTLHKVFCPNVKPFKFKLLNEDKIYDKYLEGNLFNMT